VNRYTLSSFINLSPKEDAVGKASIVDVDELVSVHRKTIETNSGYLSLGRDAATDWFQAQEDLILQTTRTGTIRVFGGTYFDKRIFVHRAKLIVVNDHGLMSGYYAIVVGGKVSIGDKTLPEAVCYHLFEDDGIVVLRITSRIRESDLRMDEKRNFKRLEQLPEG
jgi:hypothetical protein